MHTTVWGILLTAVYYQHAEEVTSILNKNAVLRERLRNIIHKNRQQLLSAAEGKQIQELAAAVHDGVSFLHELKPEAGPSLQNSLAFILWACENGYLLGSID